MKEPKSSWIKLLHVKRFYMHRMSGVNKMNKIKKTVLTVSLALFTMILSGCVNTVGQQDIVERVQSVEEPVIRWGVKADTKLFGLYDIPSQEIVGFDVDVAKALTEVMTDGKGTAELVEVNSKTRIPLLKNGNIDAIIATMSITEERQKIIDFSDVYFAAGQSLLVEENSEIQGIDTLTADHVVLAIKGSTSAQNIREAAPQVTVLEMENYSEGFIALQSGQGDALTTDNAILLGMIALNPGYRLAGDVFVDEPYGIAINKGQDAFRNEVNEALKTIQANGTYDAIYAKWFEGLMEQ